MADHVTNIRPLFPAVDHPALWMTEGGGRVKPAEINSWFAAYRDALGLSAELSPHSLRHSYVTHLTEDRVDRRFIQTQVGHRCDTSTAIYTHVARTSRILPCVGRMGGPWHHGSADPDGNAVMVRKLDYRWKLWEVMATRGMFATTDLIEPLAARGIRLSSSQVYRLVAERPERLSLKVLMAFLDILNTSMDELIEPVAVAATAPTAANEAASSAGVGDLRPKRPESPA